MKFMIIFTSSMLSNMFFTINHPIALVMMVLTQTSILCMLIFMMTSTAWFSFMLFLIMMGGIMVLFIYIASLASNEKFHFKYKTAMLLLMPMIIVMFIMLVLYNSQDYLFNYIEFKTLIYLIYSHYILYPTLISMLYLLLTLIITVDLVKLYEAPIRSLT
uniref:NADH dehydrogenase subunit 6 n=1 Tax=Tetrodontophora bielanensis TaxID=48717 RepID=Q9B507_TETBI|nr:NADH dehydrogenase subunit 6 [Tetrodontophora bielanensis]AAK30950.1 NADH dehydrogenase subunit 6 [Tetrodontophora bielanensis]